MEKDLVYASAGGSDLLLDLYLPDTAPRPHPVIVWVHGGEFRVGSKDDGQAAGAVSMVSSGYAVVAFNYRLSGQAVFPAQVHDCKAAVRWVRANATRFGLDRDRIAAWGASAGGNLAAMLGTSDGVRVLEGSGGNAQQASNVHAVVDFYGPTDFLQMDAHTPDGTMNHDAPDSPESEYIGAPIQESKAQVARANPISYVKAGAPPFLILHGDADLLVPVHQSELLYLALRSAGVDVTFHKIAGAGHGGAAFRSPLVHAMVLAFLNEHLAELKRK